MTVYTIQSPFRSGARISGYAFLDILKASGSLDSVPLWRGIAETYDTTEEAARAVYRFIIGKGHDPAVWLAICAREHTYGMNPDSVLWRNDTRAWTNARTVRDPALKRTAVVITDRVRKSGYVKYANVIDSVQDGIYRVDDPTYAYAGMTTLEQIFGVWTEDPAEYAAFVAAWLNKHADMEGASTVATPYEQIIPGLIDVRSKLATRSPGEGGVERGPYERIPLSDKRGVVIHYRGVVTAATAGLSSYQADAEYHVGKNWVGAGQTPVLGSGIMYHIGVDGEGNGYLMRDLDRVLWHCGAWPQNSNTLAIQLPLGGSQRATAPQLARTREIIDAWLRYTKAPRNEMWGHGQLSGTPCPGTLMNDLVTPYRNAVTPPAPQPPTPKPNAADEVTGKWVHEEFATTYATYGGLYVFGRPSTGAFLELHDDRERLTQYFERATFRFFPENQGEWRVQLDLLGVAALNERYPDGAPA